MPARAPEATFYLCDFDGTVALRDVGNAFFRAFALRGEEWAALLADWRSGRASAREVLARECALAAVDETRARGFVAGEPIDPAFPAFVAAVREAGGEVAIASDGLEFYVGSVLDAHGLGDVRRSANRVRFEGQRLLLEFAMEAREGCGGCGNCKAVVLEREARGYARMVFVGDGLSDRCGARRAHVVYAKGELLEWSREQGIAVLEYRDFGDVAKSEGLDLGPVLRGRA